VISEIISEMILEIIHLHLIPLLLLFISLALATGTLKEEGISFSLYYSSVIGVSKKEGISSSFLVFEEEEESTSDCLVGKAPSQ
jgi:hypothetical protein